MSARVFQNSKERTIMHLMMMVEADPILKVTNFSLFFLFFFSGKNQSFAVGSKRPERGGEE